MSPATIFRAARPAFKPTSAFTSQFTSAFRPQVRNQFKSTGKKWQSTAAPADAASTNWLKRMWDSPIGLKTVHFWAPVMKWGIVLAGVSDFYRPAESLSLTQNVALTATGAIWTRWCMIIKPKNILLATVNFFLGAVGVIQVSRILSYNYSVKNKTTAEQAVEAKDSVKETAVGIKDSVVEAAKKA